MQRPTDSLLPQVGFPECSVDGGMGVALTLPSHKHWWTLLWCHQLWSIRKLSSKDRKKLIHDVLMPLGGNILSVIREEAMTWLQSDMACPSVLVTDWRNAKPIIEQLQDKPDCTPPMLTIVVCSLRRQFPKATKWTQTLPPSVGQVYACVADQIPWSFLGEVIQKCFSPVVCDISTSSDYLFRPLELDSQVPETDIEEDHSLKQTDADGGAHLLPLAQWAPVPFPPNLPAPATFVRGPGGVLTMRV